MKTTTTENVKKVEYLPMIGDEITEPGVYVRQCSYGSADTRLIVIGEGRMQVKIAKVGDHYEKADGLLTDLWVRIPGHALTVTFTND